ncbi:MAG: hypothetical protein H0V05_13895, partial [Euzebyaceae bacterium]|nr:hypothetical protein [Euzebyaceae bacterium]
MKRAVVALMLMVLCLVAVDTKASAAAPGGGAGATEEPAEEDECPRIPPSVWIACKAARAAGDGPGAIVGAIGQNVLDQLYEWVAAAALWLLDRVLGFMQESTRPQVTAEWFGSQFGDMVTLASLLVVPLLLVAVISAMLRGRWVEAAKSALVYLPVAALGTAVAVPLVDSGIVVTDWMSDLFLAGMADDLTAFVVSVQAAMATPEGVAVGTSAGGFVAFLGALTIALGAFAIWVELVLRAAGIYVATFFLPLGFAGLVWPATRRWCGRLVKALAALILSKFVIVAAMALAASALGGASTEGFAAVVGGGAVMLMAAFSPLVLFRFADAVGDDMAASVAGTTMGRTSPVPTPAPQRTASQIYSRIMQERSSRDPSAPTSAAGGGPPDGKARDPAKNGGPAGGGARGGSAGQTPSTATPGSAGTANGAGSTAGAAKAATAGKAGTAGT